MADTNAHATAPIPVEGDGVSYSGIVWFIVVLTVTTLVCAAIVWGFFRFKMNRADAAEGAPSRFARPAGTLPPGPNLLTDEPANLQRFRLQESAEMTTYGWVDQAAGRVRLPIDRAKTLLLERGLPVRPPAGTPAPAAAAPAKPGRN